MQDERTRLISPCLKAGVLRRDLIIKTIPGTAHAQIAAPVPPPEAINPALEFLHVPDPPPFLIETTPFFISLLK